ncbi:hypothetical protein GCM10018965_075930 [Nonomuraea roseola]
MPAFVDAALTFPTVLFSFLLIVVVGYWIVVMFMGGDVDLDGVELPLGLGGIPATVAFSLYVALAWFVSLAGTELAGGGPLVLGAALAAGWAGTKLLIIPMRRLFPDRREPSRHDFVGQRCVVRTGRADAAFGQAEVTAPDGSSAVVQVRTTGGDVLSRGQAALIFDYDAEGEFFWVMEDHS